MTYECRTQNAECRIEKQADSSFSILHSAFCIHPIAAAAFLEYSLSRDRISSPVAGSLSFAISPFETNDSACLTAHHTEIAISSGGSPTALLPFTFSGLSCSIQSTLKISGTSLMFGIL